MIGGKLGVRDVDAHPQIMLGAERGGFFRENEDVLVTLPAEMPRERRHGLRNQFDAVEIELGETGGEDAIALGLPFRRERLVHGEAADIGDDRRAFGPGKELLQSARDVDDGLGLFQRIAAQAFVRCRQVHQLAAREQLGRMHHEAEVVGAGKIGPRIALHVAVAEMEFDDVGLADFQKPLRIVIADRHAPGAVETIAACGRGAVGEVALKEVVVSRHRAVEAPADQGRHFQRRQALARAFDGDIALGDHRAGWNVAGRHQALGEILAVDQLALAERAFRELLAARRLHFANARHQRLEFFRLEACRVVGAFHFAIERDVAFDHDRAHRDRAD